jgi:hypothetical protein
MMKFLGATALMLAASAALAGDFSEFDKPTVDFDRPHVLAAGTKLCTERERDASGERTGCYLLRAPAKVRVVYVVHGFSQPEFWVEPMDPKLRHAWVYRDDIRD